MAHRLEVGAVGLRIAAASSEAAAAALAGTQTGGPTSSQPSGAGVAAVSAALMSVQNRQSRRITGQADDLSLSSARYDTTDGSGADAITTVSV